MDDSPPTPPSARAYRSRRAAVLALRGWAGMGGSLGGRRGGARPLKEGNPWL